MTECPESEAISGSSTTANWLCGVEAKRGTGGSQGLCATPLEAAWPGEGAANASAALTSGKVQAPLKGAPDSDVAKVEGAMGCAWQSGADPRLAKKLGAAAEGADPALLGTVDCAAAAQLMQNLWRVLQQVQAGQAMWQPYCCWL